MITGSRYYNGEYTDVPAMGADGDKMSVLDAKMRVRGIENLRVFDVSMMPNIVAANTNAPAMAIADKATDIMLEN